MKIVWVAGARPNFMKIAPIWRAMDGYNEATLPSSPLFEPILVHTGQHYDRNMSDVFFRDLSLPRPHVFLGVGSGSHGEQVAKVLTAFEKLLADMRPDMVGVVGDVNSTLACALATAKSYVLGGRTPLLIHVEAGLRSGDRLMPEEVNRIVTDSLSDVLFTTERSGTTNLLKEGIAPEKIHFVGNVMVDSLRWARADACSASPSGMPSVDLARSRPYALVTLHRPSNVDDPEMLSGIYTALLKIAERLPVLFPVHPRTAGRLKSMGVPAVPSVAAILRDPGLHLMPPLGYNDFLELMAGAAVVVTDSGGIQEETTALSIPCLTVRENTERPVTVSAGTNTLIGKDAERLVTEVERILQGKSRKGALPPLWDGHAAERIVDVLATFMDS